MTTPNSIRIATRKSALALWQANWVKAKLEVLYPETDVILVPMTTTGDRLLQSTLSTIGGKGLFVKELEQAMYDGLADIAVHSMKDVPYQLPDGMCIAAICERASPYDAFVSDRYNQLSDLPKGSVVGTASLRRQAQLLAKYPHLSVKPIRGNVNTRLAKLESGEFDAILLAEAGLKRLGFEHRLTESLNYNWMLPAAGQGAVGIECLSERDDVCAYLRPLSHQVTLEDVLAERKVSERLQASCQLPLAVHAKREKNSEDSLTLSARLISPDGKIKIESSASMASSAYITLGDKVADSLFDQGAEKLIQAI